MPEYPTSEPVEAVLRSLGQALDLTNVGILLLNDDFHVRFANRRVTELFGFSSALLASTPKFRDLLDHVGASGLFAVADERLAEYLDQRDGAVREGSIPPTEIALRNGRRLLFCCTPCADEGRLLTYSDISQELQREAGDAVERIRADLRFQNETLEDQGAYLVALAEAADESARHVEAARLDLERKIVEHRKLEDELRRLAATDGLTGTLNRAGFFEPAQQMCEQREHLALLMVDVDHFKSINDQYGHAVGDSALRHIAVVLRQATRETDLLGRVGGEEFVVVLPNSSMAMAASVAERIRSRVAGSALEWGDRLIAMTVSVGVAIRQPNDRKIDDIMARADAALYRAKNSGRNRVEQEQREPASPGKALNLV
jgi:diguanylate cyclase (GGDEF)-like protein